MICLEKLKLVFHGGTLWDVCRIRHIAITNCPFRFAFSHLPRCGQLLRQKHRQLYMKFVCNFFLDFLIPASQANPCHSFTNCLGLLESVNLRKTCSKLHVRLPLRSKLPIYFDDVMTMENNRQVHVNIGHSVLEIVRLIGQSDLCCAWLVELVGKRHIQQYFSYICDGS